MRARTILSVIVVVLVVCGELLAGVIAKRIACIARVGAQYIEIIFLILTADTEFIVERKTLLSRMAAHLNEKLEVFIVGQKMQLIQSDEEL